MRASEHGAFVVVLGAAALLLNACQIIAGIDDYEIAQSVASGSGGNVPICKSEDLNTSPFHCGECYHLCLSGMCQGGKCITTLAALHGSAPVVALGGGRLFWGHLGSSEGMDGQLWSLNVGKTDSEPALFAEGVNPHGVTSDGVTLYWTDVKKDNGSYTKGIVAASINNTVTPVKSPAPLYHLPDDAAENIAVTPGPDGFLYWSIPLKHSIMRAPSVGGSMDSPEEIAPKVDQSNFAIDNEYIYYFSNGEVVRRTLYGDVNETPVVLATAVADAGGIAVDNENVYWSVHNADGFVYRAEKHGKGQGPVTIASEQSYPYEIAVDEHYIYWGNQGGNDCSKSTKGAVMRRPKTLEQPEEIQPSIKCPSNFAIDAFSVYWAASDSIFRFEK